MSLEGRSNGVDDGVGREVDDEGVSWVRSHAFLSLMYMSLL